MKQLNISAIVVTCNEDKYLEKCLKKLSFCRELLVVDLSSIDDSVKIANRFATKVKILKKINPVEAVHEMIVPELKYDTILITDPDEIIPDELIDKVINFFESERSFTQLNVPIQYFFKRRPLQGTIWGGKKYRKLLVNKKNVQFTSSVHRGIRLKKDKPKILNLNSEYAITHYWSDSFRDLLEKHRRYLPEEGESRFSEGQRYSWLKKIFESAQALWDGLIVRRGILGGNDEIKLSFFYVWYIWQANNSLKKYESQNK